jgi:hypothetical protein
MWKRTPPDLHRLAGAGSNGRLDAPDRTAETIEVAAASIRWRRVVGAEVAE